VGICTWIDYTNSYSGESGRTLHIKCKEHRTNIKYNEKESAFATHTLGNRHQYGRTENIMNVISTCSRKSN
jgi:hypothetical protein